MRLHKGTLVPAIVLFASGLSGCAATTAGLWANETMPLVTPGPYNDVLDADGSMPQPNGPMWDILEHFIGTDLDPAEQARHRDAEAQRRSELVAQCMAEQGFEYHFAPVNEQVDPGYWQPGNRDWVAQWGYAIVNGPVVEVEPLPHPAGESWETMSEPERQAFNDALWGPPISAPVDGGDIMGVPGHGMVDASSWETLGCDGFASQQMELESSTNPLLSDEFRPLLEAYSEFHNDLNSTLTDADSDWAECMADNRFPGLSQPRDAYNAIVRKMGELPTSATIGIVPGGEVPPELRAIADQEIEMALTDFDCRVATNFRQRQEARWFDAETQFVSDHHAAVAALVAALAQQS